MLTHRTSCVLSAFRISSAGTRRHPRVDLAADTDNGAQVREVSDQPVHGTVREWVPDRFAAEPPLLRRSRRRVTTRCFWELRQVAWHAFVRGNRYSVPSTLAHRRVSVRIGLDDTCRVFDGETLRVTHRLRPAEDGWVIVPEHHTPLWAAVAVEQRSLQVYEEVSAWN